MSLYFELAKLIILIEINKIILAYSICRALLYIELQR